MVRPVVRTAPNELSFNSPQAWQDIHVHRKGHQPMLKSPWYGTGDVVSETASLVSERDPEKHERTRKYFTHAFSDRGLREQQDLVMEVVDLFISQLTRMTLVNEVVPMRTWFNMLTFDVVGNLAFGTPPDWIVTTQELVQKVAMIEILAFRYPILGKLAALLLPRYMRKLQAEGEKHSNNSLDLIKRRIAKGTARPDFMAKIVAAKDQDGISDVRVAALASDLLPAALPNVKTFRIAGSETTSVVLSTTVYYLSRNPSCAQNLREELDAAFTDSSQIDAASTARLEYLTAVCKESMRIFPPAPFMQYRIVPKPGDTIDGNYVPGGTIVSSSQLGSSCSETYFHKPFDFLPERWLGKDCEDNLAASNPFLLGPRACIGRGMAWMEMRIVLAKLYFTFDVELLDRDLDWHRDSRMFLIWQRQELNARLHLREK
ncbi:Cytochrome P450 monooxygenase [Pseudocercospora fuligena]|uniref:Cytochrome P450 monooxygenase n=1 Tax=Pseudocercospora fuligena TaxID=685502 RepID=A0A8H6VP22_9PEZI|nr:Cytochrome P450 monooxygenase [Pseudocercospora fuligena]